MLLLPTIFARLHEKTLYIFGAVNVLSIVVVWALYPESMFSPRTVYLHNENDANIYIANQRTLEEMDLVFACDSWWTWDAERYFRQMKEESGGVSGAMRRLSLPGHVEDVDEKGSGSPNEAYVESEKV